MNKFFEYVVIGLGFGCGFLVAFAVLRFIAGLIGNAGFPALK